MYVVGTHGFRLRLQGAQRSCPRSSHGTCRGLITTTPAPLSLVTFTSFKRTFAIVGGYSHPAIGDRYVRGGGSRELLTDNPESIKFYYFYLENTPAWPAVMFLPRVSFQPDPVESFEPPVLAAREGHILGHGVKPMCDARIAHADATFELSDSAPRRFSR
jgi:hypothetical protein